ncbi:MAG: hypothetical protein K0U98_14315 [Deltaproteobacteria bacterium]|nr:hypothetical protein [Deltaproteobacteria bacterium]
MPNFDGLQHKLDDAVVEDLGVEAASLVDREAVMGETHSPSTSLETVVRCPQRQ